MVFFHSINASEGVMIIDLMSRATDSLYSGWIDMDREDGGEETMAAITDGVIHTLRERQSTNPKDKSYALHGVLQNLGFEVSDVDYQKSKGKVFHELLLDLLYWDSSAAVPLQDAGRSWNSDPEMLEAPSWVPDWTALEANPIVSWRYFTRQSDVTQPVVPSRLEAQIQFNHSLDELHVRGYWNGFTEFCTAPFHEIDVLSLDNNPVSSNVDI